MTDSVLPPGDGAEDGEPHISRRLPAEIVRSAWETIRETLPSDDREAGVFLAGLTWGFVIFWGLVILVTILYAKAAGVRL
jgi:hypothetical protein